MRMGVSECHLAWSRRARLEDLVACFTAQTLADDPEPAERLWTLSERRIESVH